MRSRKQQWKDIEGFNGKYQISNYGRVKSVQRQVVFDRVKNFKKNPTVIKVKKYFKQRMLTPSLDAAGYYHVRLYIGAYKAKLFKIHRLVAQHFLDNFDPKLTVDHIDFDKSNNKVWNLRVVSIEDNYAYYKQHYDRMPLYKSSDGELFCHFKAFCKRRKIPFSKYEFKKCVMNGTPYQDTGLIFYLIDQGQI